MANDPDTEFFKRNKHITPEQWADAAARLMAAKDAAEAPKAPAQRTPYRTPKRGLLHEPPEED